MSRIGELLVREKMLSLAQLQQAQDEAKRTGKRLGTTLARLGYVKDQDLTQFVAKQYSLPSINLSEIEIDAAVLKLVPREICEKHLLGRYQLEVIDIYQLPALAKDEQIIAAPTLIKVLPAPLRRFIGDMTRAERVLFGLDVRKAT